MKLINADKLIEELNEMVDAEHGQWSRFDDEIAFGAMNAYGNVIEIAKHMKPVDPCQKCRFTFYEKEDDANEHHL